MKAIALTICGLAATGTLVAVLFSKNHPPVRPETSGDSQATPPIVVPSRLADLTDFRYLQYAKTPLDKLNLLIGWLAEERRSPSKTTTGGGGGPIDTSYLQQQLISALHGSGADASGLKWLSESSLVRDVRIQKACRIALALRGDKSQKHALSEVLQHEPIPGYRVMAAKALGRIDAQECRALLEIVSKTDPHYVSTWENANAKARGYPVRKAAETALGMLESGEQADEATAKHEELMREFARFDTFVKDHDAALKEIARVANRSLDKPQ